MKLQNVFYLSTVNFLKVLTDSVAAFKVCVDFCLLRRNRCFYAFILYQVSAEQNQ